MAPMNRVLQITAVDPPTAYKALPSPYKVPATVRAKGGEAICEWVRKRQLADLRLTTRSTPDSPPPCASGTWHTNGRDVLKAVVERQRRALDGALAESWRRRSEKQVAIAYAAAMRGEDAPLTNNIHTPERRRR